MNKGNYILCAFQPIFLSIFVHFSNFVPSGVGMMDVAKHGSFNLHIDISEYYRTDC